MTEAWHERWNPDIGLWWKNGPGHTPAVDDAGRLHEGRMAAGIVLLAAVTNRLGEIETRAVLEALREMQETSGPHHGCFRWYWEEGVIHDTNAAFFIGLPLLALNAAFREELCARSAAVLDETLADLRVWFMEHLPARSFYYPNKYLGDLVCAWLLAEFHDNTRALAKLAGIFEDAAEYWLGNGWGWGEHLSDVYAPICLRELSLLLLLAELLPENVEQACGELLDDLLAIEDAFDGVRVPAIRSYAFHEVPTRVNFRDTVRPWDDRDAEPAGAWGDGFQHLLDDLGWHDLAGDRSEPASDITIPCYGGTSATAHVKPEVRIGSLSKSPVMPNCEHDTYGLAWQTFPVCTWRPEGQWGFLQWAVREDDELRAHPAAPEHRRTSHGCAALSRHTQPPAHGRTWALQHEGNILCLRLMPVIPGSWEHLSDRWRAIQAGSLPQTDVLSDECRAITFDSGITVASLALTPPDEWISASDNAIQDFGLHYGPDRLSGLRGIVNLWGISVDGSPDDPPTFEPDPDAPIVPRDAHQQAQILTWSWPGHTWHARIDPVSDNPLIELT